MIALTQYLAIRRLGLESYKQFQTIRFLNSSPGQYSIIRCLLQA